MSYIVINHKEVKNDVLQAKDWYKSKQKGLEKRFTNELKNNLIISLIILYYFR